MNMKQHILAALQEVFDDWEARLAGLSEAQITQPPAPSRLSAKDEIAHLMAWQQRTLARVDAVRLDREPQFPQWPAALDPEDYANTDPVNAWIYETYRDQPWSIVHQDWRAGFQRLLTSANEVPERDLLDGSRYAWLNGYPLALILIGSYDHHREHLDKLEIGDWGIEAHRHRLEADGSCS
jgi:hypothetical protein